jgi:hypothetical protein
LDTVVNDCNPGSLEEVDIVSRKEGNVPILAVLGAIHESQLDALSSIEVIHLSAVAAHHSLHLTISWEKIVIIGIFHGQHIVTRAVTHGIRVPQLFKQLDSPEANEGDQENDESD